MNRDATDIGWAALLTPHAIPSLVVLVGGVLLHSMNVLLLATILPSIVIDVGGAALMSWPFTAYLTSSIAASTCTSLLTAALGAGRAYTAGALIFCAGSLLCAFAPTMHQVVAGRFVQGFGGGLLLALAYVLVRNAFAAKLWPRVFAVLSGVWSISVLVGPLIGGLFASYGDWRGAFFSVAAIAGVLALVALRALPRGPGASRAFPGEVATGSPTRTWATTEFAMPSVPFGRVASICLAIVAMSMAAIANTSLIKASLIASAIVALGIMLRRDRAAANPLLPSDAFSLRTGSGVALWIALLVCITYSPLSIFGPVFLQRIHGFDPLAAGYGVAGASMAWTVGSVAIAGLSRRWSERMIVIGPLLMVAGLLGLAVSMPAGPVSAVLLAIILVGAGIGGCWAFVAQRIMSDARAGEENIAASAVAAVQQTGFALGAALAGLVANAAGLSVGLEGPGIVRAAFWVPISLTMTAVAASLMGARLAMFRMRPDA